MRIVLLVAFILLAESCGSTRVPCTTATCASGCCDRGECHLGSLETACGAGARQCVECAPGAKCKAGSCGLPDGGSAGGTGGGTGGAGGTGSGSGGAAGGGTGGAGGGWPTFPTDGGCWQVGSFVEDAQKARIVFGYEIHKTRGTSPNRDSLYLDTRNGQTPGTQDLSMFAPGFHQYSVWLGEGCNIDPLRFEYANEKTCTHVYLGVAGIVTVASTSGNFNAGRITGSMADIHFREALVQSSGSFVLGTRCADLASEAFDVTFP